MKYLVYYDTPANKAENRNINLAATNKIDYIWRALNQTGEPVKLISASATWNRKGCKGKTVQLSDQTTLKLFSCIGTGRRAKRVLGRMLFKTKLFLYLLCHIKKGENLMVYHSLGYADMVRRLKKIKKFRLILEVEEIYADITARERDRKKEFRVFSAADAYVFSADLLNSQINTEKKPHVVIHGTYQVEEDRNCRLFTDDKIHCVYAGTFSSKKGGVNAAIAAAEFLPEQYHVHILGSGSETYIAKMKERMNSLMDRGGCRITYDGLLREENYIRFLQSCHIGLSTQNPAGAYNDTSFPSKILSYMANGLRVVSVRIPVVERSGVGEYMYYYDQQTPEAIAKAIQQVDLQDDYNGRQVLHKLNEKFMADMRKLLEEQ